MSDSDVDEGVIDKLGLDDFGKGGGGGGKKSKKNKTGGFQALGLENSLFRSIMRLGYRVPTPIQRKVIPEALTGRDVIAMARTGSGKSAAFLIPLIQRLKEHSTTFGVRGLIVSPTREIALQTSKFLADLSKLSDLRHAVILGGESLSMQFDLIANNPDIIIGTPGRICHILGLTDLSLQSVEMVIFDEADQLFEMGFQEQISLLIKNISDRRQTLLISATLPKALAEFSQVNLRDPSVIRLDVESTLSEQLSLSFFSCRPEEKNAALMYFLQNHIPREEQIMVFASTKYHVEYLSKMATLAGLSSVCIFGEMDPFLRKDNLGRFRSGEIRICFATDVAARGVDIPKLDNVINFDFPCRPKLFVHRVGRVARAGRPGKSVSLLTPDEMPYLVDLYTFLGYKFDEQGLDKIGLLPRKFLELEMNGIDNLMKNQGQESLELKALSEVCQRAFKVYLKMRSGASPSSVRRSKELPELKVHSIFNGIIDEVEMAQQDMLKTLQTFRPAGAAFLTKGGSGKSTMAMVPGSIKTTKESITADKNTKLDVEDEDNGLEEIKETNEKQRVMRQFEAKDFKDSKYYIDSECPSSFKEDQLSVKDNTKAQSLNDHIIELFGDDQTSLVNKNRQIKKWDKTKKKYVNLHVRSETIRNSKKFEANPNSKNPYVQWKKKNRSAIPSAGTDERTMRVDQSIVDKMKRPKSRFRDRKEGLTALYEPKNLLANSGQKPKRVRSELKAPEQILKERKRKSRDIQRLKSNGGKKQRKK